ncbi:MAG: hypothetical protein M1607_03380 [Patescibacteria group bacterium]|nr:hypothetical protein [Patescibacteria group bacterium]MCL5409874.1 hypothetical protein [Patescibacteria group bacterium]
MDPKLTEEELQQIKNDRTIRQMLARNSHYWFFSIYLGHYLKYPFAPFHHDIFALTEDEALKRAVLVAFRGSGKSTLVSLSYPIWSVIGKQKKKFVLILSQTQTQARIMLTNIKRELESNQLLKADVGPFEEDSDEWGSTSLVLRYYNARITCASVDQSIRGIRHKEYRPDLVILDDVEDLQSAKTKEGRDKTYAWLVGEVFPIGDQDTKTLIVGNLLHEDCLLMRLKNLMAQGKMQGKFLSFPILSEDNQIAWPGKFADLEAIEKLRNNTGNEAAWHREYLLRIISDTERLVHPEWIHYYDEIYPEQGNDFRYIATGVDLAISIRELADYTAMVSAKVFGYQEKLKIFILPNPINKRLSFPETFDLAKNLSVSLGDGYPTKLFIEDVGYQRALIEQLVTNNIPAEGAKVFGQDKRSRLALITHLIQQGKIVFPKKGAEELILQLTGFGIEKHDDLADAFSLLILKILEIDNKPVPRLVVLDLRNPSDVGWHRLSDERHIRDIT